MLGLRETTAFGLGWTGSVGGVTLSGMGSSFWGLANGGVHWAYWREVSAEFWQLADARSPARVRVCHVMDEAR